MSAEKLIREVVERLGWSLAVISDDLFRLTGVGSRDKGILLRIDPLGYISAAIVPIVKVPRETRLATALYERLLELNHQILMARFCIDDDLDVILAVDHPLADLDASELQAALELLEHYCELHLSALEALVADEGQPLPSSSRG